MFFSLAIMSPISFWRQLEIRWQEIYYNYSFEWKDITNYSWHEKFHTLELEIKDLSENSKKLEITIAKDEKEEISVILQHKLNLSK